MSAGARSTQGLAAIRPYSNFDIREARLCAAEAPCHAKIATLTQQVKEADYRANIERSARLTLDEKQVKLVQSYNDLNNYHQTARVEYQSLELAFKRLNMAKTEESRRREYVEHLLECEKFTRGQADKRFAELLASMKTLALTFHTLAIEKSTLTEDEKKAEGQLDYGSVFLEKEMIKHERDKLLHAQAENEKTILSLRNQLLQHQ